MNIRPALPDDLPAITAIYNDAVKNSLAVWTETAADLDNRRQWLTQRLAAGYPVLVAEENGHVAGYASYGPFRAFEGYRHTAELSIYLEAAARGKGLGKKLVQALIDEARRQNMHTLIAGIEAGNTASLRLHASLGFIETARMPQLGRKFGQWLDLVFMQRSVVL